MGRVGYLLKRITSMDYGKMFGTVNEVHKKCKKGRISIFIDIIKCGMKYQAGYMDYKLFEMYDLNDKQRETTLFLSVIYKTSFLFLFNTQYKWVFTQLYQILIYLSIGHNNIV